MHVQPVQENLAQGHHFYLAAQILKKTTNSIAILILEYSRNEDWFRRMWVEAPGRYIA